MKRNEFLRGVRTAGAALLIAAASGCAYQLGSTLPPGIQSVHVPTVVNQTGEPQIDSEVTRQLVREFQRDGTLRVADAETADARLDVTLTSFKLEPLAYDRNQSKTTREYRMWIEADITMFKGKSETPMLHRHVEGDTTFDFFGDLASSKIQALPNAATDLAHHIVEVIVEYW